MSEKETKTRIAIKMNDGSTLYHYCPHEKDGLNFCKEIKEKLGQNSALMTCRNTAGGRAVTVFDPQKYVSYTPEKKDGQKWVQRDEPWDC